MTDSLGHRMKFAVVAPSTNTSVEPEYAMMRPRGVTNHFSRIAIPDTKVTDDDSFMVMLNAIRTSTFDAVDVSMSMDPGCVIMGMSAETFWDGAAGAELLHRKMIERTGGVPDILGSTAVDAAIKAYKPATARSGRSASSLPICRSATVTCRNSSRTRAITSSISSG